MVKRILAIIVAFGGPSGLEQWNQRLAELLAAHTAATNTEIAVVI